MLIRKPQVNIISREVTLATGEVVRAFFAVIVTEGVPEVRFLGTQSIEAQAEREEVLMLAAPRVCSECCELFISKFIEAISPFYTLDFLTSQLARAPSVR
ncbi:MAG: hypothetical protein KGH68_01550 [Patescibacteria group bacterium]|nr:hypothetical protein [Patescibacteria group bacterium]